MANVYSKRLLTRHAGTTGRVDAIVPAGFVWVVRHIDMSNGQAAFKGTPGFGVWCTPTAGADFAIFLVSDLEAHAFHTYQWDGHCVLNPGDDLYVFTTDTNWSGHATGWQLTLP